jgi:hypothetical protein
MLELVEAEFGDLIDALGYSDAGAPSEVDAEERRSRATSRASA